MKDVPSGIPKPSLAKNPQAVKKSPTAVGKKVGFSKRGGGKVNTGKR